MAKRLQYLEDIKKITLGNTVEHGVLPLGEIEINLSFDIALKTHSRYRPRILVEKIDGNDSFDYALATKLTLWKVDFSVIRKVEYPVDDTDQTADYLTDDEWEIYHKPDGYYLRFKEDTPDATEDIRVTYTTFHTCTVTGDATISEYDEEAVKILGASLFCEMFATYYAQSQDCSIDADSVNHTSKSKDYTARAIVLRNLYFKHLGIDESGTRAASFNLEWDKNASWGSQKLTHNPKYR